jgi:hypothetical protein
MIWVLTMHFKTMHWSRKQSLVSFYVHMNSALSSVCNRFSTLYVEVIHLILIFNSSRYIFTRWMVSLIFILSCTYAYFLLLFCLFFFSYNDRLECEHSTSVLLLRVKIQWKKIIFFDTKPFMEKPYNISGMYKFNDAANAFYAYCFVVLCIIYK